MIDYELSSIFSYISNPFAVFIKSKSVNILLEIGLIFFLSMEWFQYQTGLTNLMQIEG